MNVDLNILCIISILCCFGCLSESEKWSTMEIRKLSDGSKAELANPNEGDVVAFKAGTEGYSMYDFAYYHSVSGNLKSYHAMYAGEMNFEKGFYRWKDDTTVVIKLQNARLDSTIILEFFGNGPRSGMRIEDQ